MRWIVSAALLAACGSAKPQPTPAPKPTPAPPPAPAVKSLDGVWLGKLDLGGGHSLALQLRIAGAQCALDSIDQKAFNIPCTATTSPTEISVDVPAVKGTLKGSVSADAKTIIAKWAQPGNELPLTLARQDKPIEPPKIVFDPEMPAVDLDKIQAALDADFKTATSTVFAPATGVGVTIGIISKGTRKVFSYGSVKPDSVFEIGSMTKTFTGLVLAQMVEQKQVKLDTPVRELLPTGTVAAPASGKEITLLDLAAQHSGLPRMPDNFHPKDETNPYADYDTKLLYAWMSSHGVGIPDHAPFGYSNLGMGLLGQALANRAKTTYEALVKKEVTAPLGMTETVVKLTPALAKRFATGHDQEAKPTHAWDLDALAGAGALRSTANDILTYLDAQMHPDKIKPKSPEAKTLPAAIAATHEVRGDSMEGMHIGLNWLRVDATGMYWHNGATGGFSSFSLFDPEKDLGVVVLLNESNGLADLIAQHILQRMLGKPAIAIIQ